MLADSISLAANETGLDPAQLSLALQFIATRECLPGSHEPDMWAMLIGDIGNAAQHHVTRRALNNLTAPPAPQETPAAPEEPAAEPEAKASFFRQLANRFNS